MAGTNAETLSHDRGRLSAQEVWRLHLMLALGLALCAVAFWFELSRALGGNALSWAYVFEWPLLGTFAVYMWWQLLHPGRDNRVNRKVKSLDPAFQGMLERWEESREDLELPRPGDGDTTEGSEQGVE